MNYDYVPYTYTPVMELVPIPQNIPPTIAPMPQPLVTQQPLPLVTPGPIVVEPEEYIEPFYLPPPPPEPLMHYPSRNLVYIDEKNQIQIYIGAGLALLLVTILIILCGMMILSCDK